jgi:hypothetical protein
MTSVDNPTISCAGGDDVVDHAARITHDDAVLQHYIGVRLTWQEKTKKNGLFLSYPLENLGR